MNLSKFEILAKTLYNFQWNGQALVQEWMSFGDPSFKGKAKTIVHRLCSYHPDFFWLFCLCGICSYLALSSMLIEGRESRCFWYGMFLITLLVWYFALILAGQSLKFTAKHCGSRNVSMKHTFFQRVNSSVERANHETPPNKNLIVDWGLEQVGSWYLTTKVSTSTKIIILQLDIETEFLISQHKEFIQKSSYNKHSKKLFMNSFQN